MKLTIIKPFIIVNYAFLMERSYWINDKFNFKQRING